MSSLQQSPSRSPTRMSKRIWTKPGTQPESDGNFSNIEEDNQLTGSPNKSVVIRAVYQPGSKAGGALAHPSSSSSVSMKELVELRWDRENLVRENERKDKRNEMLSHEAVRLRAVNATLEHDVKIIRAMYEKLGTEKQILVNDFEICKDQRTQLERQFMRLGNGPALQAQVDALKGQVDSLNNELSVCYGTISSRDLTIKEMNIEIDALNIALEKQVLYEGTARTKYNGVGRETLRDLYLDIGRKQAEIHSLSATLSEAHEKHGVLQKSYDTALDILQSTRVDLEKSRDEYRELSEVSEKRDDEIGVLRRHNNELRDAIANLEAVVADLSSRLAETHDRAASLALENAAQSEALHELQLESSHMISTLSGRVDTLEVSLQHRDNTIKLLEQRAAREKDAMEREREEFQARVDRGSEVEAQFDAFRRSSLESMQEKNMRIIALEDELHSLNARNESLLGKEALFEKVVTERDVMSESLQRSLDASKTLFDKLQGEIALRESLESRLEETSSQLKVAEDQIRNFESVKHQYAYAILDAYQQEKEKNAQLERMLLLQRSSNGGTSSSSSGSTSASDDSLSGSIQSPYRGTSFTASQLQHHSYSQSLPPVPPAYVASPGSPAPMTPTRGGISSNMYAHTGVQTPGSRSGDAFSTTLRSSGSSGGVGDESELEANQNMVAQTHNILQKLQRIRGEMNKISEVSPISVPPESRSSMSGENSDVAAAHVDVLAKNDLSLSDLASADLF